MYGGAEAYLHVFLTSALWSLRSRRRFDGPQSSADNFQREKKNYCPPNISLKYLHIILPSIITYFQVTFFSSDFPNRALCLSLTDPKAVALPANANLSDWTIIILRHGEKKKNTALALAARYKPSRR